MIEQLGPNLFKVKTSWKMWSPVKVLIQAILKLQAEGKTITAIRYITSWNSYYLVCTQ